LRGSHLTDCLPLEDELARRGDMPFDRRLRGWRVAAGDCSELSEYRVDTGWIPAQPSGLRLELTVGAAADVIVEYTSRTRPD
jgi:hypothetical protein